MTVGETARRIMGPRLVPKVSRVYRRVFVDLDDVALDLATSLPDRAQVFDVGGGSGDLVNHLLAVRPDASVTMIDIAEELGGSVAPEYLSQVRTFPGVSIREYLTAHPDDLSQYDVIVLSDVLHHVPVAARDEFLADLRDLWRACDCSIYVKEMQPSGVRARLGYWADVYISGDKNTSFVDARHLARKLEDVFGPGTVAPTLLYRMDRPNYAIRVRSPKSD